MMQGAAPSVESAHPPASAHMSPTRRAGECPGSHR